MGLGDAVSAVTHSLGFKECGGCARRREWLNRLLTLSRAPDHLTAYILAQQLRKETHGKATDKTPPTAPDA